MLWWVLAAGNTSIPNPIISTIYRHFLFALTISDKLSALRIPKYESLNNLHEQQGHDMWLMLFWFFDVLYKLAILSAALLQQAPIQTQNLDSIAQLQQAQLQQAHYAQAHAQAAQQQQLLAMQVQAQQGQPAGVFLLTT